MAERRMFAKTIIDSDAFLDMPLSSQALYFHLAMRADDDGFINSPKKIQRVIGGSDDDLKLLIAKRFIIPFESGVVVIKHWKIHNFIRNDRYKPTVYQDEMACLSTKENRAYSIDCSEVSELLPAGMPVGIPNDNQVGASWETQVRLGKDSIGKSSVVKESAAAAPPAPAPRPKPEKHKYGTYGWVRLTDAQYAKLVKDLGQAELDRCIAYVDESAQSNSNKNKWSDWNLVIRKCNREGWGRNRGGYSQRGDTGFQTSNPFMEMLNERRGGG